LASDVVREDKVEYYHVEEGREQNKIHIAIPAPSSESTQTN
jgi:hypothetical protein